MNTLLTPFAVSASHAVRTVTKPVRAELVEAWMGSTSALRQAQGERCARQAQGERCARQAHQERNAMGELEEKSN